MCTYIYIYIYISSPAPDLVFFRLIFPRVFFSGGVFFRRHRYVPESLLQILVRKTQTIYTYTYIII